MNLSAEDKASFREDGYLILRNLLSQLETETLQRWAAEVQAWPVDQDSPWMPYEEINVDGKAVLSRTENFVTSHPGLNDLLRGDRLLHVLRDLSGGDMVLFKEKLNYKLSGSGGSVLQRRICSMFNRADSL